MALFKLMSAMCAAQLLWQTANGADGIGDAQNSNLAASAEHVSCLKPMNEARTAAGLKNFTENSRLAVPAASDTSVTSPDQVWEQFCATIRHGVFLLGDTWESVGGTFAFYPQNSNKADCEGATRYWKSGYTIFGTDLPPKYSEANRGVYKDSKASSFVALYNSQENAGVYCSLVTCPIPNGQEEGAQYTGNNAYGLVCQTTPKALTEGEYPYTKEQWKQITDAFASSGSVASPTLLAFAAVVAGLSLL